MGGKRASAAAASSAAGKQRRKTEATHDEALAKPAVGADAGLDTEMAMLASVNGPTWANFQKLINTILSHPEFKDVDKTQPPAISADKDVSGSQDPFDPKKFAMAMDRTKEYKCANNFFKRNMLYTATPSLP